MSNKKNPTRKYFKDEGNDSYQWNDDFLSLQVKKLEKIRNELIAFSKTNNVYFSYDIIDTGLEFFIEDLKKFKGKKK